MKNSKIGLSGDKNQSNRPVLLMKYDNEFITTICKKDDYNAGQYIIITHSVSAINMIKMYDQHINKAMNDRQACSVCPDGAGGRVVILTVQNRLSKYNVCTCT